MRKKKKNWRVGDLIQVDEHPNEHTVYRIVELQTDGVLARVVAVIEHGEIKVQSYGPNSIRFRKGYEILRPFPASELLDLVLLSEE